MQLLDPLLIVVHNASTSFTGLRDTTGFRQLSQMLLTFFHTSEYILAIAIHGPSNVTLTLLLISKNYALAMLLALLEYLTEVT
ncbi:unnamed protein product, partial [Brassica rapa subsp. trilocularis]